MKKFFVLIILSLCLFAVNAQMVETSYYFEAEYMPTGAVTGFEIAPTYVDIDGNEYRFVLPYVDSYAQDFRFVFNVEFLWWEHWFVGGRLSSTFGLMADKVYGVEGSIGAVDSLVFLGYRYKGLEIGLQRFCIHPVVPNSYAKFLTTMDGEVSWGKLYIRISGKL